CMRKNFKAVCKKFKLDYRHDTVTGTAMIATIFEVTSEDAPEPTMEGVPESIATHVPEPIVQDAPEPTSEDTVEITNTIPEAKYVELFRITKLMTDTIQDIRVVGRKHGFYNAATFVEVKDGENVTEYVVRVPGHSTTDQWTENDAYVLEREAQLIEHIRKNTTAPVPHVIAYCSSHDNLLGFPYILMTKLPGQTADTMWDDGSQLSNQAPEFGFDPFYLAADVPSAVMEKKRLRFLRSLARIMLEIQTLSFPHIGMPIFNPDGSLEEATNQRISLVDRFQDDYLLCDDRESATLCMAAEAIFHMIFNLPVFTEQNETFTIRHNDLDLQNILVEEEGNITGIIDWDNAIAAPRSIGTAAVPVFLRNDWFPDWANDLRTPQSMAWNHHYYRQIYAAALMEAGSENAKYTIKSALYQAVWCAITGSGSQTDLVEKVLREIPNFRGTNVNDFKLALGQGKWTAAENMLKKQLPKIFEPELPPEGLLAKLDFELDMQTTWWTSCDELIALFEAKRRVADDSAEESDDSAASWNTTEFRTSPHVLI
ncbi:APH domain-containing protein, partial [Pyrenophora tritici-repentis]